MMGMVANVSNILPSQGRQASRQCVWGAKHSSAWILRKWDRLHQCAAVRGEVCLTSSWGMWRRKRTRCLCYSDNGMRSEPESNSVHVLFLDCSSFISCCRICDRMGRKSSAGAVISISFDVWMKRKFLVVPFHRSMTAETSALTVRDSAV